MPTHDTFGRACAVSAPSTCAACAVGDLPTVFEATSGLVVDDRPATTINVRLCDCLAACRACGGTGRMIVRDPDGYETSTACELRKRRLQAQLLTDAAIPVQYVTTRRSFYTDEAQRDRVRRVQRWINDGANGGIWLSGHPGRGKSCLAVIALAMYADRWTRRAAKSGGLVWADTPTLLRKTRAAERERGAPSPLKRAISCALLVLDDLDKVITTSTRAGNLLDARDDELLWRLLKSRTERGLSTFITSNILHDTWLQRTRNRDALTSRVNGHFQLMGMPGADHRATPTPTQDRLL